jgi:hypothetical protein
MSAFEILFPDGYFERREAETPAKGWLDVRVRLENGSVYKLSFYDPVRLRQTLDDQLEHGLSHYTEPGLVLLTEVTTENVKRAVAELVKDDFFSTLSPIGGRQR